MSRFIDATLRFVDQFTQPMQRAVGQLERSARNIQRFGKDVQRTGKKMENVGSTLTKSLTVPILGLGAGAVKTAAEFEQGMSKVQSISSASAADMDKLGKKAKEMGAKTKFSAKESADAFSYMAMAGWDAEKMLGGIEGVMYLAGATGTDLARTSDIVTDAMTAFGLEADKTSKVLKNGVKVEVNNTTRFTDVLAQTARRANTNTELLGETFKYVAPVAGALGYTVEDTATAIGLMANAGIKGSQAGTQLRAAMANLANPSDKQKAMMDKLGLSLTNENGEMKSLMEVMEMLREKMKTLSKEEQQANIEALTGISMKQASKEALQGMTEEEIRNKAALSEGLKLIKNYDEGMLNSALYKKYSKKELKDMTEEQKRNLVATQQGQIKIVGMTKAQQAQSAAVVMGKEAMSGWLSIINASGDDFKNLTEEIENSNGAAKEMYDVANDNLIGQLTILKSTIETTAIAFGDRLTPYVKKATAKIQELADKFSKLTPKQQDQIIKMGVMAAAVGPCIFAFGKLTHSTGKAIEKLGEYGKKIPIIAKRGKDAFNILKTIHIPVPKGIGKLGKISASLGSKIGLLANPLNKIGSKILGLASKSNLLSMIFQKAGKAVTFLKIPLGNIGSSFLGFITKSNLVRSSLINMSITTHFLSNRFGGLLSPISKLGKGFVNLVSKSNLLNLPFRLLSGYFGIFGKMTAKLFSPFLKLGGMFGTVGKAMFTFLGPTGTVIAVLAALVIGGILVYKNWDKIKKAALNLGKTIKSVFLKSGIDVDKLQERIAGMKEAATKLFGKVGKAAGKLTTALKPVLKIVGHTLLNVFKVAFSGIVGYASGLLNGIVEVGSGVMKALGGVIDFLEGVFTGNWKKAWEGVKTIFKGVFDSLVGLCKTPLNAVIGLFNGVIKGINNLGIDIPDWVPGLGGEKLHFDLPTFKMLYKGTNNWQGGPAMIHDRGAEIVDLPTGTRVYPHDKSLQMARAEGRKEGNGIRINIEKLADEIIVREDSDIERIADAAANRIVTKLLEVRNNMGGVELADLA